MKNKEALRVKKILELLAAHYPHAATALNFNNPFELLVAVVLSAQCTDKAVNKVTANLFKKYPTPADLARLTPEELAEEIKTLGLYRNKSKHLVTTARMLMEQYHSRVPETRAELEQLPGVGHKSAGVILGVAFNQQTFPVDTHVHRVSHRLGLSSGKSPLQTEQELCRCVPPELWQPAHHWLILHGRQICLARYPRCRQCMLTELCPGVQNKEEKN